jgi:hypothetical protein
MDPGRLIVASFGAQNPHLTIPDAENLATAITDIQVETTITGASQLRVTLVDHEWDLLTSGWLDTDAHGFLPKLYVGYPRGSGIVWILSAVDVTTDLSQANLTLTFEDVVVAQMRDKHGPKQATRSPSMTRARFIRSLVKDAVPGAKFHCPELDVVQPVQQDLKALATSVLADASGAVSGATSASGLASAVTGVSEDTARRSTARSARRTRRSGADPPRLRGHRQGRQGGRLAGREHRDGAVGRAQPERAGARGRRDDVRRHGRVGVPRHPERGRVELHRRLPGLEEHLQRVRHGARGALLPEGRLGFQAGGAIHLARRA